MSSRLWLISLAILLASTGPVSAQPPSPLELVRGIREAGMPDLALEYLKEIENQPMSENDKKAIGLERAKCLLDSAESEPDEGTRTSMVGEAKERLNEFVNKNPTHPRVAEASIALARLISIDAKTQLNRAKRIEVGDDGELKKLQAKESEAARPLFLLASKRFAEAALQIKAKLDDPAIDAATKASLTREAFDADLAAAINQHSLAGTFLGQAGQDTLDRDKFLVEARDGFAKLAKGQPNSRMVWIARAWMAETLMDQGKPNEGDAEFNAILAATIPEAEEGKRLVRFFQIRRAYLSALAQPTSAKLQSSERELRNWLSRYGGNIKPTPEALSARFYLAFLLQLQADIGIPKTKGGFKLTEQVIGALKNENVPDAVLTKLNPLKNKDYPRDEFSDEVSKLLSDDEAKRFLNPILNQAKPKAVPIVVGATARRQFEEAEKLYRVLSQSDNDYTQRASKNRMHVVRMLLGEAERPASEYTSFETAQMAALIQMAKLTDAEKDLPKLAAKVSEAEKDQRALAAAGAELIKRKAEAEVKDRRFRILALLERARELASDKDNPGDVTDNLLRLVYFYQLSNEPYQAAVLGEYMAKTVKTAGGKASLAGLLAINGYIVASTKIKGPADPEDKAAVEEAMTARKSDRERAARLAHYLDEKFPNDAATDAARVRLARMLLEEKRPDQAFEMIVKVHPGFAQAASARLLEGYIASQLIASRANDAPLPPGGKPAVYRRAIADLERVVAPVPSAREEDVSDYLSVRARLALLYLAQSRAEDKEAEASGPGYEKALRIADEMIALVPTFDCLKGKEAGKLSPKGLEMNFLALDARARAIYLRGKALVDASDHDWAKAAAAIEPAIADVEKNGALYDETMRRWSGGEGDPEDDDATKAQKARVAPLARGIDQTRREIVMVGFKLRVRQGNTGEATKMLDLLVKAGGTIEENQPTLEFMARSLAVEIPALKKAGQVAEAKAMGDGLAILLKRLSEIPNLTSASTLFLGQTLCLVEQYADALKEFEKIPVPVAPILPATIPNAAKGTDWWTIDPSKLDKDPNNPAKRKFLEQIRDYRPAQLFSARCYRGLNKLPEAEKLLVGAVGTQEKQGYAYASLDFRRELALVYEAKGAATADPKVAKEEWGKALKEWNTLFSFARGDVGKLKDSNPEQEKLAKNRFFDAYFDVQRCIIQANSQLLKGNPNLAKTFADVGKKINDMETVNKFAELEKKGTGLITPEVWNRYCDLLDRYPELKNAYKAAGGKFFLERPKE